jgi:hypothetical protein
MNILRVEEETVSKSQHRVNVEKKSTSNKDNSARDPLKLWILKALLARLALWM